MLHLHAASSGGPVDVCALWTVPQPLLALSHGFIITAAPLMDVRLWMSAFAMGNAHSPCPRVL